MTSFLAWLASDKFRKTGVYFASDSRLTQKDGSYSDDCVKLFCPTNAPDIFGMLGKDIAFPKRALPQICNEIDNGLIPLGVATSAQARADFVSERLMELKTSHLGGDDFTIFHACRSGYNLRSNFALNCHRFSAVSNSWLHEDFTLELEESSAIVFDGSGWKSVFNSVVPLAESVGKVSRIYFEGFCNTLESGSEDPLSGGAPQLVGLGSVGGGRCYGVSTSSGLFFRGLPATFDSVPERTQWRNAAFQQVDSNGPQMKNRRRKLIKGAKRPPKPA